MTATTAILGGVFMAHAPQFFTLPESEDRATVERIRALAQENGRRLRALEPDLTVVIANDHANLFLLHCVPAFMLHRGAQAKGSFAGRDYAYPMAHEAAGALLRHLQAEGFDPAFSSTAALDYAFGIPLDFLGHTGPILPLFVNAYLPPQPGIERCYALGQALGRGIAALDLRAVVVASGGLSHFPGTDRYSQPDLDFDTKLMAELAGATCAGCSRSIQRASMRPETSNSAAGPSAPACWGNASRTWFLSTLPGTTTMRRSPGGRRPRARKRRRTIPRSPPNASP